MKITHTSHIVRPVTLQTECFHRSKTTMALLHGTVLHPSPAPWRGYIYTRYIWKQHVYVHYYYPYRIASSQWKCNFLCAQQTCLNCSFKIQFLDSETWNLLMTLWKSKCVQIKGTWGRVVYLDIGRMLLKIFIKNVFVTCVMYLGVFINVIQVSRCASLQCGLLLCNKILPHLYLPCRIYLDGIGVFFY